MFSNKNLILFTITFFLLFCSCNKEQTVEQKKAEPLEKTHSECFFWSAPNFFYSNNFWKYHRFFKPGLELPDSSKDIYINIGANMLVAGLCMLNNDTSNAIIPLIKSNDSLFKYLNRFIRVKTKDIEIKYNIIINVVDKCYGYDKLYRGFINDKELKLLDAKYASILFGTCIEYYNLLVTQIEVKKISIDDFLSEQQYLEFLTSFLNDCYESKKADKYLTEMKTLRALFEFANDDYKTYSEKDSLKNDEMICNIDSLQPIIKRIKDLKIRYIGN